MKKVHKKSTGMVLSALLALTVVVPVASADSSQDVMNYYESQGTVVTTDFFSNDSSTVNNSASYMLRTAKVENNTVSEQAKTVINTTTISLYEDNLKKLDSNDDSTRRNAVSEVFSAPLTDEDVWEDKSGEKSPMGTTYTSHEDMKKAGFYAINASRQELIKYGIRTDDWQPYRWFQALQEPAYFEYVKETGKLEYNKNYYASMADSLIPQYRASAASATTDEDKKLYEGIYQSQLKEYVKNYNEAPGYAVYSSSLNSSEAVRKETGAIAYDEKYFDSIWSKQVTKRGNFEDGSNPFKDLLKQLKEEKSETETPKQ